MILTRRKSPNGLLLMPRLRKKSLLRTKNLSFGSIITTLIFHLIMALHKRLPTIRKELSMEAAIPTVRNLELIVDFGAAPTAKRFFFIKRMNVWWQIIL